jgi:hypothetical protein
MVGPGRRAASASAVGPGSKCTTRTKTRAAKTAACEADRPVTPPPTRKTGDHDAAGQEPAVRKTFVTAALIGTAASFPASKLKGTIEGLLQQVAEARWPPTEQEMQLVGAIPPVTSKTCRPRSWPTALLRRWPGAARHADEASGTEGRPLRLRSCVRRCLRRPAETSRLRPVEWGRSRGPACTREAMGRPCRYCGSRRLPGACCAPQSCGSSRVTRCSASPGVGRRSASRHLRLPVRLRR